MDSFSQAYKCGCVAEGKGKAPEKCPSHGVDKQLHLDYAMMIHLRAVDPDDCDDY